MDVDCKQIISDILRAELQSTKLTRSEQMTCKKNSTKKLYTEIFSESLIRT